jgi:transcriptional regulator with XRE-family HTH domain
MTKERGQSVTTLNKQYLDVWRKLASSEQYRDAFVISVFKRMLPFQIRAQRKKMGWSQARLAKEANITQGVVSRAEDPDYGNLTVNTICRFASGFDVAFVGKLVAFSELDRSFVELSEESVQVPSFEEENQALMNVLGSINIEETIFQGEQGREQGRHP